MFIQVDSAKIFTTAFGPPSAPTILGIGGWIGSWELWAHPFSLLSKKWHTIAYDHRGSGATLAPVETISIDVLVDDVFAVLDAYEVEHCVLAAESAGAAVALSAALKNPTRIDALILVDGYIENTTPEDKDAFLMGLKTNYKATLERFIQTCVPEEDCEHIKHWGRQILERATPEAAIALYQMIGPLKLREKLNSIKQPVLILHGEADMLVPVERAHALASTLPNAKLRIFPRTGHIPTLTRPVEVAGEIDAFMNDNQGHLVQ